MSSQLKLTSAQGFSLLEALHLTDGIILVGAGLNNAFYFNQPQLASSRKLLNDIKDDRLSLVRDRFPQV